MGEANLHFFPYFCHTVDGRNPAPPWMAETLEIMGCLPSVNWCSISSIHSMFIGFHRQNPLFFPFSLGFPRSRSTFSPYVPRFSEAKSHPHPFPVAQIAEAPQCRCSWPLASKRSARSFSMLVWMSAGSVALRLGRNDVRYPLVISH